MTTSSVAQDRVTIGSSKGTDDLGPIVGEIDLFGTELATGWAASPSSPFIPLTVQIVEQGHLLAEVVADQPRPDLKSKFGTHHQHGFRCRLTGLGVKNPYALQFLIKGTNTELLRPAGWTSLYVVIEEITPQAILGWAFDSFDPHRHIDLQFTHGTTNLGGVTANRNRPDLGQAGIGKGDHAFLFAIPPGVKIDPAQLHVTERGAVDRAPKPPRPATLPEPPKAKAAAPPTPEPAPPKVGAKDSQDWASFDPKPIIAQQKLFDAKWYSRKYQIESASPDLALQEYLDVGASAGRDPNPLFDSKFYKSTYMQKDSREPPLTHYLRIGANLGHSPNAIIDANHVKTQLQAHGLSDSVLGALLHKCSAFRISPNPCFSTDFYLKRYPEIVARRVHPVIHYLQNGYLENRIPHPLFWPEWFRKEAKSLSPNDNPLIAYLTNSKLHEVSPCPYFDPSVYRTNADLRSGNPLSHYITQGDQTAKSPNLNLDADWVRSQYAIQLKHLNIDSLSFLLLYGNGFLVANPARLPLRLNPGADPQLVASLQAKLSSGIAAVPRRRNRLVYLSHNLKIQGAQTSLFELAVGSSRDSNNDVAVLAPDEGPMKQRYREAGIPVHKYMLPVAGMADEKNYLRLFDKFMAQIKDLAPDIVHGNTVQSYHAMAACGRLGIPAVWNIRESEIPTSHFSSLENGAQILLNEAIESAAQFVFVSRTTERLWLEYYPKIKSKTISNGIKYSNFQVNGKEVGRTLSRAMLGVSPDEIMIFNVGTWTERKGQKDIVEAVAQTHRQIWPRIRVVLIGANESAYGAEIRHDIDKLPLALRSRFSVFPESSAIADRVIVLSAYHAADIFAFTSRIESYPRVINEVLYFGIPLITTPCFGVIEQIKPGKTGLTYEAGETQTLARHIEALVADPLLRARMGHDARTSSTTDVIQYDEMIAAYKLIYEELRLRRPAS